MIRGWIGVDLDGTLATHDGKQSKRIGEPIPAIGQVLQIQAHKDYFMIELWDDRAVQVQMKPGSKSVCPD